VARGSDFLIDGGLANNLPIDVMADLYGGRIVAVDVIPDVDLEAQGSFPAVTSGAKELYRLVRSGFSRKGGGRMPSVLSTLMRTATSSAQGLRAGAAAVRPSDLVLRPALTRWNMLDFSSAERIADEGYRQAVQPVKAWWEAHRDEVLGRQTAG
jgi:predicted acylesterase/phospholipase RssA